MMNKGLATALGWVVASVGLTPALAAREYLVKLRPEVDAEFVSTDLQVAIKDRHSPGGLVLVEDNTDSPVSLETLSNHSQVEYAVPNIKLKAFFEGTDPRISEQWALEKVRAEQAWDIERGSHEVVVAVIDTGIDYNHPDLKENIWANEGEIAGNGIDDDGNGYVDDIQGWDFFDKDNTPMDETSSRNPGHGTHCAGIIGAAGNNGIGISGIAPVVKMIPIRFLGADGSGDLMSAVKAIDYATAAGAQIISASWGAAVPRAGAKPILEAIERAGEQGILFVAAAANDGKSNDTREVYPANAGFDNVISVAASDVQDNKPAWSNFGRKEVHVAAPGAAILSTLPGGKYGELSGTSMATPLVSGLAVLALAQSARVDREISPLELRSILQSTGMDSEIETACACRVDALGVVESVRDHSLTLVPAAASLAVEASKQLDAIGGSGPYSFKSLDDSIATVDASGTVTGVTEGSVQIEVSDADGEVAESRPFYIGKAGSTGPTPECPFQDPQLCMLMCQISPQLPWCQ